jgi:hypothetical protein
MLPAIAGPLEQSVYVQKGSTSRLTRLGFYIYFLLNIIPEFWKLFDHPTHMYSIVYPMYFSLYLFIHFKFLYFVSAEIREYFTNKFHSH